MQKKACVVWLKKLQGVQQTAPLQQQGFSSFTFYKTQRSYEKIMCVYFLFHWFSGENCLFLLYIKDNRLQKKHEWWYYHFSNVFTYCFFFLLLKKETLTQVFSCEFCIFSKNFIDDTIPSRNFKFQKKILFCC